MLLTCLNIQKSEIPCEKIFVVGENEFAFLFMYNDVFDFYTVIIKDMDGRIILSNKLSYMRNAFAPVVESMPKAALFPLSLAELESKEPVFNRISADNFDSIRIVLT